MGNARKPISRTRTWAAVALKNEARAASPDKGRVQHALGRLAEAAAPAAGMIELARQLADLVGQLVH
jgi:hypothetical protein